MESTPSVLDLFCGAGGLALGFKRAGFDVRASFDANRYAVKTHEYNLRDNAHVAEISESTDLPPTDVIIGGPPCQGFSSAGARRPGDPRNSLVSCYSAIIERLRPRAFVFENVEGFLTAEGGTRVLELLRPLVAAGYRIHLRKINAANYGVPQHRKRVVAIGGLGWSPSFPEPTHRAFGAPGAHRAAKVRLDYHALPHTPTVEEALAGLPLASTTSPGVPQGHWAKPLEGVDLQRAAALAPGQTMRDLPQELWHDSYRRRAFRRVMDGTPSERRGGAPAGLRRLKPNEPSKAVTSGARAEFLHPTEHRPLTIRECARLQSFPDDFEFFGPQNEQMLLIGNAVPPRLAEVIARSLRTDLQSVPDPDARGALLTFVPTASDGVSPALRQTIDLVAANFGGTHSPRTEEELALW